MYNWVQVSITGETLPLKIGTAIRRISEERGLSENRRWGSAGAKRLWDFGQNMQRWVGMVSGIKEAGLINGPAKFSATIMPGNWSAMEVGWFIFTFKLVGAVKNPDMLLRRHAVNRMQS
jgi:hypothetical protein